VAKHNDPRNLLSILVRVVKILLKPLDLPALHPVLIIVVEVRLGIKHHPVHLPIIKRVVQTRVLCESVLWHIEPLYVLCEVVVFLVIPRAAHIRNFGRVVLYLVEKVIPNSSIIAI
jgi:hypothetical protein